MEKIVGKPFKNQDIILDDHHYEGCEFESCVFIYAGFNSFRLENNAISTDCKFMFAGAAGNAVTALKAIYAMGEWGRRHVIATFQDIAPDIKNLH